MTPSNRDLTIRDLKHMTRRTSGLEKINVEPDDWYIENINNPIMCNRITGERMGINDGIRRPYSLVSPYQTGQILFLKEAHYAYGYWRQVNNTDNGFDYKMMFTRSLGFTIYFKDNKPPDIKILKGFGGLGWYRRSPMFMFTKDARYFVKVLSVSVGRLLDITNEDCIAEGIHEWYSDQWGKLYSWDDNMRLFDTPKEAYLAEWDEINGKINGGIYHSSRNPWNFSYTYQLIDRPENLK
jgi:hypothetical protein